MMWVEILFTVALLVAPLVWGGIARMMKQWASARCYHDGIFAILRVLDYPLEDWEHRLRGTMNESEWFGYQRGYTQGLLDALQYLGHPHPPPLHSNRLEPRPRDHV